MNATDMIFGTVGGLALFLYGMGLLSDGLKLAAGDRLRSMLEKVTRYRLTALLTGAGVTCLVQSSSATTVMVVGLINAGLLSLSQAISVILGANIGTTITGWLVAAVAGLKAFKISTYALPFVGIGFVMFSFGKRQRAKTIGQIVLGLGLLFIGLSFMKEACGDLGDKESSPLIGILQTIGDQPILAVLAGTIFTMIIQSSSASIAMVIVLAANGGFGSENWSDAFRIAIPFVLGDNIGTTITAQLAAIQSNASGKRAAMAHSLFNVTGVVIMLPLVYFGLYSRAIEAVIPFEITKLTIGVFIAISHSAFNVIAALIVLPFVGVLEKIVLRILPIRKEELELRPVTLEEHLLDTPTLAMQQIRREMVRMAKTAQSATELAIDALQEDNPKRIKDVYRKEEATDDFQTEITRYLVALSTRPLEIHFSNEIPVLLHNVNDIERIGDHAMNIAESATRKIDKKFTFGPEANKEITRMRGQVGEMCDNVIQAIRENDTAAAAKAMENEGAINEMLSQFRRNHVHRLSDGTCKPLAGLVFVDTIQNLEKIGDHLTNIAQGVLGGGEWTGQLKIQTAAEPQPDTDGA